MTNLIIMLTIITSIFSFFCGSIPSGYIIVKKFYGIDIRTKGSGNIGSTNVRRVVGNKAAIATQAMDVIKGFVPVAVAMVLGKIFNLLDFYNTYLSVTAIAAILGHDFSPFLKFNGGKGINTTLGAFVLIAPIPTLASVVIHIGLKFCISIVAIRSIILGIVIPVICIIMQYPTPVVVSAIAAGVLIVFRHKGNIREIINGTN